ncbi:ATP-dependent DNA ligase [Glaciihabitans sp. INWT7]|uniref:ATP-dependent DNA ligase n=1 Tax=Glaciihabitans sp. INWT7 TaxID=2596912 RepID=UPI001628C76E|nr:ATP-dependent DNA ligase [Glaciihabitans sp. INWT7]QNE45893.1 ATP-dependent DNA ligase [Glaciihabitans sp. INWT7]
MSTTGRPRGQDARWNPSNSRKRVTVPQKTVVEVGGHRITLTNLDKVLYPHTQTTKGDVLSYYAAVADVLIAHAAQRPATRKRWVDGVGTEAHPGTAFLQKNLDDATPRWVKRRAIEHSGHSNEYPLVNDLATLTWLGQIAALEIHVPQWRFGRTGHPLNPDRLVLDLDPGEGVGLSECAEVARLAKAILDGMGLRAIPVTSGSKGIHLYAPLDGSQDASAVSAVAHELARALEADHPELVVSDMKKSTRLGRVLVDWSQNNGAKTTITPYSLRGAESPTVAAPRSWSELEEKGLRQLQYSEVEARIESMGDPLAALAMGHLESLEPTAEHRSRFETSAAGLDRLAEYRRKRDAAKTPEPVPTGDSAPTAGDSFVIQEHHARRLHWDFRLEHDGVLVSWALPKGVPTDSAQNHLAVQTEDHPLEYGTFEGRIPAGEYGGGEVTIWDSGTVELEKWREGKEVIATLHGEQHGSHRYALIHTGGAGRAENDWLIHLMADTTSAAPKPARSRKVVGATPGAVDTIRPMLATPGKAGQLSEDDEWAFEMKWDGIRAIASVSDGVVTITSRNGIDLTTSYPELAALADAVEGDAVVDGEIVAISPSGRPDFGLLQRRMGLTKAADVAAVLRSVPVQFMAFDLLSLSGRSLVKQPYDARRTALEQHLFPRGSIQLPPAFEGDEVAAISSSLALRLEGVVAKRRDSTYLAGKRSRSWVKFKHHRTQEVIVGGWTSGRGNRAGRIGALLLGVPRDGGLSFVGKVGTGFSDADLDAALKRLAPLARTTSPFADIDSADSTGAHWVTPRLVGEVEFAEWTATTRLRHPTWRGWRPDKSPDDITFEG